jgi:hypothetical protein
MKSLIISGIIILAVGLLAPQITKAQGTAYVSNLDEPSIGGSPVGSDSVNRGSFITGNNAGGYLLNSIQLAMTDATGSPNSFVVTLYVNTNPFTGSLSSLGALNGSTDPETAGIYTYTSPSNLILSPDSDYVFKMTAGTAIASGAYEWSATSTSSSNASDGWLGSGIDEPSGGTIFINGQYAITAAPIPEPSILGLSSLGGLLFIWPRQKTKVAK